MEMLKEINQSVNYADLLAKIAPMTKLLQNAQKKSEATPVFNLKEYDSCYLLSIDLPNLKDGSVGIEVSHERLQLVEKNKKSTVPPAILFQCDSGKEVKAYYMDGILWMVLPKNSASELLDLPRIASALAC